MSKVFIADGLFLFCYFVILMLFNVDWYFSFCCLLQMKDKGMCNVMHCGKCGIYWNWKTRETGTSSSQLKNKARRNGTLWEPGELRYQQELQRNNLPEFKKLLERNGIKYDPNYVRGTR